MERFQRLRSIVTGATTLLAVSACSAATRETDVKAASDPATPAAVASESIGTATQEADGTIVLMLRATGPDAIGDAQFRYPPTHAQYAMIKAHVGPIAPGKSVMVRPFPGK